MQATKKSKVRAGKGNKTQRVAQKAATSNRPRYSRSPSPAPSAAADGEDDDRAAQLEAYEQMQAAFLADALPEASTSGTQLAASKPKPIWEMEMDDFDDDEESDDEDDDEEEEDGGEASTSQARGPVVIAFEEPRLTDAPISAGGRAMRDFMSGKITNSRPTVSVADLVNAKRKGKAKVVESVDAEEEARLASLDSDLSSLIRPLTSASGTTHSQLPSLLASLQTAPTKPLKGHTPLPPNAPRTLRKGQNAANLKRAQLRDDAAGVLAGAKRGREALTLKEKRHLEGSDKRQRGLNGAVGKFSRGGLTLTKEEVMSVSGGGGERSSRGGGRGGARGGGRGGKRGGGRGGKK